MYWQEQARHEPFEVPDDIVDIVFKIRGRTLPLDHAYPLSEALCHALPWLRDEEAAGIHSIHVAASGNGWQRPQDPLVELLYLSRRTRLTLRLPKDRLGDATRLRGKTLDIAGHAITAEQSTVKKLSTVGTQFARYIASSPEESEQRFLERVAELLSAMGLPVRRLLCGRAHEVRTGQGSLFTRSLMVADLSSEDAVKLQQQGLGAGRKLGCGLFIAHKGIDAVPANEKD